MTIHKFRKNDIAENSLSKSSSPSFPTVNEEKNNILNQNKDLMGKLKEISSIVQTQEGELQEKDQKISKLQTNCSELSEVNRKLTKEIEKYQNELSNLTMSKQTNSTNREKEELLKRISEQNNLIAQIKQEKNDFKKQNTILLDEYNKLQKEFQILLDRQSQLQNDLILKKEKNKNLEIEILEQKNKFLKQKINQDQELMKENHELIERMNKLQDEKKSLLDENERIYQLLQDVDSNNDKFKEMKETILQHQNNENLLLLKQKENQETIKKKDEMIRKYEEKIKILKEELNTSKKEQEINQNLIKQLTKLKDNYLKDQDKIRTLESHLSQYKDKEYMKNEKKELEIEELLSTIRDYQGKITFLNQELENFKEKNEKVKSSPNSVEEEKKVLYEYQQKILLLNQELEKEIKKNKDLLAENEKLIKENEGKQSKINDLQKTFNENSSRQSFKNIKESKTNKEMLINLEESQLKVKNYEEEIQNYQNEIDDLKEIIQEKEGNIKKLTVL